MTQNKNLAVVSGGVGGIGFAIVSKLLDRGDHVVVFDCLEENDNAVLNAKKIGAEYIKVDISNVSSIENGFKILQEKFNGENLTIFVNNAGVARDNLAVRLTEKDWDFVLDVNLKGTFFCCQQAIKSMMKKKKGYIVNISSIVGIEGNAGQVNYAASKAGIIALTKSLSKEYASRNILINAIAPGFIQTKMTESLPQNLKDYVLDRISLKKLGHPEDVANLVEFLTSGKADYICGEIIRIDGGLS
ncbi:TPA: beta-ketoacyl-ACP reductase [Candidatus Dependentiae bacterium]|nr:MAG: 3-oxoacyl-(Acyl-carrier-protein) reductase [candidate division TM6 bacterium GW2011_GWF2_33_332]HBS48118.1 beta-ketoacyl-ACP reductase [Candidatus Dependentiae bacterium]HBZ73542.1 beta-ketoacyl-ACP reductase [Candidatus Dependentiae bacterium]